MRLPQSSTTHFSIRAFSTLCFVLLTMWFLLSTPAAAQQLTSSMSSLRFGMVPVGQTETQYLDLTNNGTTNVTISATSTTSTDFSVSGLNLPATVNAGQSVGLSVTFSPTAAAWTGARLIVNSNATNPNLQVSLAGDGVSSDAMTAVPGSLSFGQVAVGSKKNLTVVLTNVRTWKETITAFQAAGSEFTVSGPTLPAVLSAGQNATLTITFAPRSAGEVGGGVFIVGPGLNIPFTGTGTSATVGQLSVSPTTLNFGSVLVGDQGQQSILLTASGGSVTVNSGSSNNSQFTLPGSSFPFTIPAGQGVQLTGAFIPTKTGNTSGTFTFFSNATNSPDSESVNGTGTPPEVSLSWNPSTSQVVGYNVYRKLAASGSYTKINSSLDPNTSYLDTSVVAGQTYDYATTAVNSSGQESQYSNQVQIAIP